MIHIFIWTLSALYGCIGSVYTRHWMTENSDVKLAHLPLVVLFIATWPAVMLMFGLYWLLTKATFPDIVIAKKRSL